jgi:hypothetical protein
VLVAALRRLTIVFAVLFGGTVVVSALLGLLFGATAQRSVSLGLDLVGSFFLVIGFFVGVRGPFRLGGGDSSAAGNRFVRWAQPDERVETINLSALLVTVGFVLVLVGLAIDPRYSLI